MSNGQFWFVYLAGFVVGAFSVGVPVALEKWIHWQANDEV